MGRLGLVCLILAQILVVRAMAEESEGSELKPFQNKVRKLGVVVRVAAQPVSSSAKSSEGEEDSKVAEAPVIRRLGKQHESEKKHHHSDRSDMAGGGVIIGGLFTAIFAAVFCYIRVTRRRDDVH
ncbi:hypothetical protein I3760_03G158900 [Carya illinoinensis]|nr:hypothetical protein I3760_03G158900 [Carya illinoinensis]